MNTPRLLFATTSVLALTAAGSLAWAQPAPASFGIAEGVIQGHAWRNGGIGLEEQAEMHHDLKGYDLQLTLSEGPHGAYATGVRLTISDAAGHKVLTLPDAGPLLDVNLPAGSYRVRADFGRFKRVAKVDVRSDAVARLYLNAPREAS
jgi:hypothetical protein